MSLGNGAWNKEGGAPSQSQPNGKGIHDNPVSSNHQALSPVRTVETKILTWYLPCQDGEGRAGNKLSENYPVAKTNVEWLHIWSWAVNHIKTPAYSPRPPCTNALGATASQHCFALT